MEASLDTNVIIHLYKASFQGILFSRFKKVKVHEFIRYHEMNNHADKGTIALFDHDVEQGKIQVITDAYLRQIGMYQIFQQHVKEFRILFAGGDLGEVYAISLAKTLGCISLVTDDIKERGPHYTLMRIPDSDIMPLAFYELLFLDFLEQRITEEKLVECFRAICNFSQLKMNCIAKLKEFIRRFWLSPYNSTEKEWMKSFCSGRGINSKERMRILSAYLK
jgi:hypothetical protein